VRARDLRQLQEESAVELAELGLESLDEAEVELRAVAADEVHLARKTRQGGKIAERSARDHGDHGLGERGQRAHRRDGLGKRPGCRRVVDERSERAVVVATDEELRYLRDSR
jgi:hypothetical protein